MSKESVNNIFFKKDKVWCIIFKGNLQIFREILNEIKKEFILKLKNLEIKSLIIISRISILVMFEKNDIEINLTDFIQFKRILYLIEQLKQKLQNDYDDNKQFPNKIKFILLNMIKNITIYAQRVLDYFSKK